MSERTHYMCESCYTMTPADEIKAERCATCRGCDTCDGTGVMFRLKSSLSSRIVDHKIREEVHIEKCDSCDRYETNDKAAQAVIYTWEEMAYEERKLP